VKIAFRIAGDPRLDFHPYCLDKTLLWEKNARANKIPVSSEHFDAVVIGSGFGGSVTSYRLAEAGLSVCVLERGKPYPPGSFPRTPYDFRNSFWNPGEGQFGLFDVRSFSGGLSAVVSSALGGGSLLYNSVLARKDERWFVREEPHDGTYERWPVTRADLDPHYDTVEKILSPQVYPAHAKPYSDMLRMRALEEAAKKLGQRNPDMSWYLPNLGITFHNEGAPPVPGEQILANYPNLHNRQRSTCRLCSECYVGCNFGSKNSLDFNYLSLATLRNAEIRTLCEVRGFRPREMGGFEISYVVHDNSNSGDGNGNGAKSPAHRIITADRLTLSAGTFGSTYLLLKNRDAFPGLSSMLGAKLSGNGDYLAIAFDCQTKGPAGSSPRFLNPTFGPAIASTVRMKDTVDGGSGPGIYLQDAGFPAFVGWIAEAVDAPGILFRTISYLIDRIFSRKSNGRGPEIAREFRKILGAVAISSNSMGLVAMGRDRPAGKMYLEHADKSGEPYLDARFPMNESRAYLDRVRETAKQLAEAMGGEFKEDPTAELLKQLVTVHPLGGCSMGENASQGVVDSYGEVFGFKDFYIADGSVMPGPVGANPSLTIAALANRTADHILESRRPNSNLLNVGASKSA
jgi:cholesterol oxidase